MNKTIIGIAMFIIGGGIGYWIADKKLENQYAELAQEEIDSVKHVYAQQFASLSSDNDKTINEESESMPNSDIHIESSLTGSDRSIPGEKVAYHNIAKEQLGIDRESEIEHRNVFDCEIANDMVESTKLDKSQPYEISAEAFDDEFVEHDKVSIYYYAVDDVLCDEHEEVINNVEETVGHECFNTLETQSTAWVRNERISVDYEICVVNSSYAEIVHGIPSKTLSPREQYRNRQSRRGHDEE